MARHFTVGRLLDTVKAMGNAVPATEIIAEQTAEHNTAETVPTVTPFMKWAGGKRRLARELLAHIAQLPASYGTYFEPMVGAGALFFALRPKAAELSDINPEIVNVFNVLRDQPGALVAYLRYHHQQKHSRKHYYRVRDADRDSGFWTWSPLERAARLLYLNKTCFNGLYRVNSRGEFNVPMGRYTNPRIVDEEQLYAAAHMLQGVPIAERSFESVLERAQKGDLVYFDPPYFPLNKTSSFTTYSSSGFELTDHVRLRDVCSELTKRGVYVMVSNSAADVVRELYADFSIHPVLAARAINSKASKRGKIEELIIRNY